MQGGKTGKDAEVAASGGCPGSARPPRPLLNEGIWLKKHQQALETLQSNKRR